MRIQAAFRATSASGGTIRAIFHRERVTADRRFGKVEGLGRAVRHILSAIMEGAALEWISPRSTVFHSPSLPSSMTFLYVRQTVSLMSR